MITILFMIFISLSWASPFLEERVNEEIPQVGIDSRNETTDLIYYVIRKVIERGEEFSIVKINNVQKQALSSGLSYKIDADIINDKILTEIQLRFTAYYKPNTNEGYIMNYLYDISFSEDSAPPRRSYKLISQGSINSSKNYQDIIRSGVKNFLRLFYQQKGINDKKYSVKKILDFFESTTSSNHYRFTVELENEAKIHLKATLGIQVEPYDYKSVLSYSVEGFNTKDKTQLLIADYRLFDKYWYLAGNYNSIPLNEIDIDPEAKETVEFGTKEAINKIIDRENYLVDDIKMEKIKSVYRDAFNGDIYRVRVILEIPRKEVVVECLFLVKSLGLESSKEFLSYAYVIY